MTYTKSKSTCRLYLETDGSGVGLGAGLLHVQDEINCTQDETTDKQYYDIQHLPVRIFQVLKVDTAIWKGKE